MAYYVDSSVTSSRVLDRTSFPMRLWQRAKVLGVWNPQGIDLTKDQQGWHDLPRRKRERMVQLWSLFGTGEEAVTLDLLPLMHVIASEGRLEEEMYLTSFLFEEAKHVDICARMFEEVFDGQGNLARFCPPSYQRLMHDELPSALSRLYVDRSVEAQIGASVTYNMVVEGVMAETGYYLLNRLLAGSDGLPGMKQAVRYLQRDEARHIAFGIYFISRHIVEHGDLAYSAFLERVWALQPLLYESADEFIKTVMPDSSIGVTEEELRRFSDEQFANRVQRISRARNLRRVQ